MADRVEALVLQMSADIRKLETGLEKARKKANTDLGVVEKRFDQSSAKIKKTSSGMAANFENATRGIPVIGEGLSKLGLAGVAAGTGILAAGFAMKSAMDAANAARIAIDGMATSAQNVGTSAETFQALSAEATRLDVTVETLEKGLSKLQLGAAQAAMKQGDLYSALVKTQPALLEQIIAAQTQEDRWDALSRAITAEESTLGKVSIARAAFGKASGQMVRLLDGEQQTVKELTIKYRDMGLILSEDLVAAVAAADERMTLANARMEINGKRAAAAMIPVVETLTTTWQNLNIAVGEWFDRWNDPEGQQISTLSGTIAIQEKAINQLYKTWMEADKRLAEARAANAAPFILSIREQQEAEARSAFFREQEAYQANRALLEAKRAEINKGPTSDGTIDPEIALEEAERLAEEAAQAAARRATELEGQRMRAAQVLGELGDITQLVAAKEKEMNELVAAGLLTRAQADAAVEKYAASFDKVTDAEKEAIRLQQEWQAVIERSLNPTEQAQVALDAFWDAVAEGMGGDAEQAAAVLKVLEENLQEAKDAANEATPAFKAVAAARLAIAEAAVQSMSSADRIAAERARLQGLVGVDGFTQAEADQAVAVLTDAETAGFRDATRDAVKQGLAEGLATDDWGGAIRNILADSIVAGLDSALNVLADALTNFLLGSTTGGGALDATFAAVAGFLGFGGARAKGGPVQGGKSYLVGENGPELLRLGAGQNGQVFNASQINGMSTGGGAGGATYVDASIRVGGVDMATWPQVRAALDRQAYEIAARIPGGVNATLADNRRQKRRF